MENNTKKKCVSRGKTEKERIHEKSIQQCTEKNETKTEIKNESKSG